MNNRRTLKRQYNVRNKSRTSFTRTGCNTRSRANVGGGGGVRIPDIDGHFKKNVLGSWKYYTPREKIFGKAKYKPSVVYSISQCCNNFATSYTPDRLVKKLNSIRS